MRLPKTLRLPLLACVFLIELAPRALGEEPLAADATIHFPIDHVAWILDQGTLDALAESPFLQNEFANSGTKTIGDGQHRQAFYLYGRHTQYLEFMSQVRQPDLEVVPGDGMVAFNAEQEGSVDWIISRMGERHPESRPSPNRCHTPLGERTARASTVSWSCS